MDCAKVSLRRRSRTTEDQPRRSRRIRHKGAASAHLATQTRPQNILTILPAHLLDHVLSFLDRPSLCTARLVCKAFCQAASESIRTLRVPLHTTRPRPLHGLQRFPMLKAVECSTDLALPHQPETPDWLVEHVTGATVVGGRGNPLSDADLQEFEAAVQAALRLPRLTSLELSDLPELFFKRPKTWDRALGPPGATQLRRLCVSRWSPPLLERVAQLTRLTMLHLIRCDYIWGHVCPDLGPLSALRHLQELGVEWRGSVWRGDVPMLPHQFSGLRGLTWVVLNTAWRPAHVDRCVPFLKAMTRLRSLELDLYTEQQAADLITMSQLCALTLHFYSMCCPLPISLAGARALSRLTSLGIIRRGEGVPLLVSEGDFPALQNLTLDGLRLEGLQQLAPLFHSSITKLVLQPAPVVVTKSPLSELLTCLPNLQALEMSVVTDSRVLSLLTGPLRRLTELVIKAGDLDDSHAHCFTNLQELRSLVLDFNYAMTAGFLMPLTGLTQLSRLSLRYCSRVRPEDALIFRTRIDAARAAFAWPPLEVVGKPLPLSVQSSETRGSKGSD